MSTTSRKRRRQIDARRRRRAKRHIVAFRRNMAWIRMMEERMGLVPMIEPDCPPGVVYFINPGSPPEHWLHEPSGEAFTVQREPARVAGMIVDIAPDPVDAEVFKRHVDEVRRAGADVGSMRQAQTGQDKSATAMYVLGMLSEDEWRYRNHGTFVQRCPVHLCDEPCPTCQAYIAAGL
jgi:hypothetical protein